MSFLRFLNYIAILLMAAFILMWIFTFIVFLIGDYSFARDLVFANSFIGLAYAALGWINCIPEV